ncbi:MAG: ATP-binding protein [bacterium]
MNKFIQNFKYSRIYLKEIFAVAVISLALLLFFIDFSATERVLIIILSVIMIIICLYYIGEKTGQRDEQIIKLIKTIRENKVQSIDEIKLGRDYIELENEIKETFVKIQNDLSNMKKLELARTEFLGNVSHELRTPIFAIQGFIETLLDGAINDSKVNKKFLEKALRHTGNLNDLLNDLIDISMIESGQMSMSYRYFGFKEYLVNIVSEYKPAAEKKNLELKLGYINPDLKVFGDKDRLKQVFRNLISNAIKYTDAGEVYVEVIEEEKVVTCLICDSGIGISSKEISRIFERFYRTELGKTKSEAGTGLGLAIVKHILEAHQTKIEVSSQLGDGSKFSFRLKK